MKLSWPTMDKYHKVVCPTIQICLTIGAITVAFFVYGIQKETAERTKNELNGRIEKLTEINNKLSDQQDHLEKQSKNLAKQQAQLEQQNDSLRFLYIDYVESSRDSINFVNAQSMYYNSQLAALQMSVLTVAKIQAKGPPYIADDLALLETVLEVLAKNFQMINYDTQRISESQKMMATIDAKYKQRLQIESPERRSQLASESLQAVQAHCTSSIAQVKKDLAPIQERLTQLLPMLVEQLTKFDERQAKKEGKKDDK